MLSSSNCLLCTARCELFAELFADFSTSQFLFFSITPSGKPNQTFTEAEVGIRKEHPLALHCTKDWRTLARSLGRFSFAGGRRRSAAALCQSILKKINNARSNTCMLVEIYQQKKWQKSASPTPLIKKTERKQERGKKPAFRESEQHLHSPGNRATRFLDPLE